MAALGIPLPPEVAGQMPNMSDFAAQGNQMMGGGGAPPQGAPADPAQADPTTFANDGLNQIAELLGRIAQVVLQTRPELGPLVKKMAEAGSALQQGLAAQPQGDESNQTPATPEGPEDVGVA